MKLKLLSQKHDSYKGDLYTKYQSLYEGGELFHANIKQFLTKNGLESDAMYKRRCQEACYQPYVNAIIDQFSSQLFACPFAIKTDSEVEDDWYSSFKEDIDPLGTGQDLANFMRDCFTGSLIKGCSWILAERAQATEEETPDNLFDQKKAGLDVAWLREIKPENVFYWQVDDNFQFEFVITYQKKVRRVNPRDEKKMVTETWKIYDQLDVETFSITYETNKKPNDDTEVPSTDKRAHGFTGVPLIRLCLPRGLWLMNRLADAQIEHFRSDNILGWAMRRSCFPTAVYKTDDDDKGNLVTSVDGFGIKIGANEEFDWVGAPSDSFKVMSDRVATFKDEIHRLALQMSLAVDNSPGAVMRSGDSKAMDAQATEICLHAYAAVVKATVEEVFELISDARGDVDLTFSIEGMDQFNIIETDSIIASAVSAKALGVNSVIFQKEIQCQVAEALLPNVSESIKKQIREQIMASSVTTEPAQPDNNQDSKDKS